MKVTQVFGLTQRTFKGSLEAGVLDWGRGLVEGAGREGWGGKWWKGQKECLSSVSLSIPDIMRLASPHFPEFQLAQCVPPLQTDGCLPV